MNHDDADIRRLYQRASQELPPIELDRKILRQAHRTRRRSLSPFGGHWLLAGTAATLAVVGLSLGLFLEPEITPQKIITSQPVPRTPGRERLLDALPDRGASTTPNLHQAPAASYSLRAPEKMEKRRLGKARPDPALQELETIRRMAEAGKLHAALVRLRKFVQQHPEVPLPEELQQLLE